MGNPNTDFLEKAAVAGLSIPAALMAGKMAGEIIEGGNTPIDKRGKPPTKREEDIKRLKEKYGEEKESGGDTKQPPKTMKKGGSISSASKRADGCAIRGKTKGRMV